MKKKRLCLNCRSVLGPRHKVIYCSNKCQIQLNHKIWVESWRNGKNDGSIGITVKTISGHIKRYLRNKYNNKCSSCGWNKKHIITGVIPLEIDHVDGNSDNNREENLRLLCTNCHSLTPYFKNLNKGNGRKWRMNKYIRNT